MLRAAPRKKRHRGNHAWTIARSVPNLSFAASDTRHARTGSIPLLAHGTSCWQKWIPFAHPFPVHCLISRHTRMRAAPLLSLPPLPCKTSKIGPCGRFPASGAKMLRLWHAACNLLCSTLGKRGGQALFLLRGLPADGYGSRRPEFHVFSSRDGAHSPRRAAPKKPEGQKAHSPRPQGPGNTYKPNSQTTSKQFPKTRPPNLNQTSTSRQKPQPTSFVSTSTRPRRDLLHVGAGLFCAPCKALPAGGDRRLRQHPRACCHMSASIRAVSLDTAPNLVAKGLLESSC